jgi:hypothetical protein
VPEAIPGVHLRRLLRLVLAVVGLLALADRAEASGCHAAERPTIGIADESADSQPTSRLTDPVHYRRSPCPGESAGLPSKIQIPDSQSSTPTSIDPSIKVEPQVIEPDDRRPPLAESHPLERPPRALPSV